MDSLKEQQENLRVAGGLKEKLESFVGGLKEKLESFAGSLKGQLEKEQLEWHS